MKIIDKVALLYVKDGKILSTRSKGKDKYYLPGGKREGDEADLETLARNQGRTECGSCGSHSQILRYI